MSSSSDRDAAILEGDGYLYARDVDEKPRDDTRKAAIGEGSANWYAINADKVPRNNTLEAPINDRGQAGYDEFITKFYFIN